MKTNAYSLKRAIEEYIMLNNFLFHIEKIFTFFRRISCVRA